MSTTIGSNKVVFFTGQTSNASSSDKQVNFSGHRGLLVVDGGFGGGTFTLLMKTVAGNYVALNNEQGSAISLTAAGTVEINMIPYGALLRGTLAGATSATLNAYLLEVNTSR